MAVGMTLAKGRLDLHIKPVRVRFDDNQWHRIIVHRKVQEVRKFIRLIFVNLAGKFKRRKKKERKKDIIILIIYCYLLTLAFHTVTFYKFQVWISIYLESNDLIRIIFVFFSKWHSLYNASLKIILILNYFLYSK